VRRPFALFFAVLAFAAPATAREIAPRDLERAKIFAERMQKVYEEGRALSTKLVDAERYIRRFQAGDVERAEFAAALDPFLQDMRVAVDEYRRRYPRAPLPPRIGNPEKERNLGLLAETVVEFGDLLDRHLQLLGRLRAAALADDREAYNLATADSLALSRRLVQAENISLVASLLTIEPNHPKRGLMKAIIGGNEAMAVSLKLVEADFRGTEFDAGKLSLEVETALRDAQRGIVAGETATRRMFQSLEGKFAKTEADRHRARYIGEMVEAYERAFAIEREILRVERGLLDYLRAVNSGSETADTAVVTVGEIQTELAEWTALRIEEQEFRQAMSAELARKLQAAPN
jgi:hypothetical protein